MICRVNRIGGIYMKKNKKLLRKAVCTLVLAGGICLTSFGAEPMETYNPYLGGVLTAYAEEKMSGYENPKDIIIAAPASETYSTTASKVSILGACDYRYELYMNGRKVETTEYGFFTEYVNLMVGKNVFKFTNGENTHTLTITRKEKSSSSGGSSSSGTANTYKSVSGKIGELKWSYTMPFLIPGVADVSLLPLTKNTTFRIIGEQGNYYKIADGTFVSKSAVQVYKASMPENPVNKIAMSYKEKTNTVETTITMKMDALYDVQCSGDTVKLVLYDTTAKKVPTIPENPLVSKVSVTTDSQGRSIYTYKLASEDLLCGFDVTLNNGTMTFILKTVPVLEKRGSLEGAVILLDAGHGDDDPGAVGPMGKQGPTEKDINLRIMQYAAEELKKRGATVVVTRNDDTFYSLDARVQKIRDVKPDLSISVHGNSLAVTSNYGTTSGFLTFYSYNKFHDAVNTINTTICEEMGFKPYSIRQANLSLTRLTICPAVLLETAFLSNPSDYEFLIQEENQKDFGKAIAQAAQEYLEGIATYKQKIVATHTVKKGDTLSSIARKYGVTIQDLQAVNTIPNKNVIYIGQKINIPEK